LGLVVKLGVALGMEVELEEEAEPELEPEVRVLEDGGEAVALLHFRRLELLIRELENGATETDDGAGVVLFPLPEALETLPVRGLELGRTGVGDCREIVPMPNSGALEAALVRELELEMTVQVVMDGVAVVTLALLELPRDRLPVRELALKGRVAINGVGTVTPPALCPLTVTVNVEVVVVVTVTVPFVVPLVVLGS
jgi:hypothetical protein